MSIPFVTKRVVDRYDVKIPKYLAEYHDWWGTWEKFRFESMEANLKPGDILFDVGAEIGWISAIYARFVGAENMVMFEPVPNNWTMIREIWSQNGLPLPYQCVVALVSDKTVSSTPDFDQSQHDGWPSTAFGTLLTDRNFRYIHEHAATTPQLTIDDFVATTKIVPDALTIDIEGAELLALKGAEATLRMRNLLVWVSVHPEMMAQNYTPTKPQDVLDFMGSLGYDCTHLGYDHEDHWFFQRKP